MVEKIHKSWYEAFGVNTKEELEKKWSDFISWYKPNYTPEPEYVFAPFEMPLEEVQCVVIGQDPYPNGEGVGYAFAYKPEYRKPASFKKIEQELGKELSPSLDEWKKIGVMSINSALTTVLGTPGAHRELWKRFTAKWITYLTENKSGITFLLLGRVAAQFAPYAKNAFVFTAPHPATRYHNFVGCGIFNNYKPFKTI